jgi:Zn-dependent protease
MEPEKKKKSGSWGPLGGIAAFLAIALGKLKFLIPLLKLGKIGGTIWSMALMIGAYAFIYPWTFAIGIVVMIFIHEMGHVVAAKRKGIPVTAPAFIPFLGALITLKRQPVDAATEAYLAFGGPLLGSIGAFVVFLLAYAFQSPILLSIAQVGFFLNLINLVPIHPLDGGRIVTAISRWLWVAGLIGGLVIILYLKAIIFLIFWAMFAWELYKKFVRKDGTKKTSLHEAGIIIDIRKEKFLDYGLPVPAESHQRELPFVQACDLSNQEAYCDVFYPGVGFLTRVPFHQGLVDRVRLLGTIQEDQTVRMKVRLDFLLYPEYQSPMMQKEEYYQVSVRTRLLFGISYVGLAAFLAWMMYKVQSFYPISPIFS